MSEQFPRKAEKQSPQEFIGAIEQVGSPLVHVVMFNFHEEASPEQVTKAIRMCRALKELPGVLAWTVQESLDNRKGRTVLELGVFENGQAFLDFRNDPTHQEFANYVRDHADWNIVDFPVSESSNETVNLLADLTKSQKDQDS
jgi:heme-degrading monooxygenase HmoA